MKTTENMPTREISGFMEQWKRHPLAVPIVIILITSAFLLILLQGQIDYYKLQIAYLFTIFTFGIFLIVIAVLICRKFVFYNLTELIILEVERNIQDIQDSLADIEIGYGMAFDHLRAPRINDELNELVRRFEILIKLLNNISYTPKTNDKSIKALAKYYFRKEKFKKGLDWIDKVSDKNDSESNFIKGLLLWSMKYHKNSREYFEKSIEQKAYYYKYVTYLKDNHNKLENINKYINEVTNVESPLYADCYAQVNLGNAYRFLADFPINDGDDINYLQKALSTAQRLIILAEEPFAYYNAACYVCLLGKIKGKLDDKTEYDEKKYATMVIKYLNIAFSRHLPLLEQAVSDVDLEWIKQTDSQQEFYDVIGRAYVRLKSK